MTKKLISLRQIPRSNEFMRLMELNGPYPGISSEICRPHYQSVDSSTPSFDTTCVVPTTGYNFSFAKNIYVEVFDFPLLTELTGHIVIHNIGLIFEMEEVPGIEILLGHGRADHILGNGIGDMLYSQSRGLVGVTGFPFYDVVEGHPMFREGSRSSVSAIDYKYKVYWIDRLSYCYNFKSNMFVSQIRISPDAHPGEQFAFCKFDIVCEVDEHN
jgi:hypothetical protein